jgi:TPR repeat protein
MRRSDWPYIVLTLAVFAISGGLFYSMGKRDGSFDIPPSAEGPLVVVPLDEEADALIEELARKEDELAKSKTEIEALSKQVEGLQRTTEILKKSAALLGEQKATAQRFYAMEMERSASLLSSVNSLEQTITLLKEDMAARDESIAALEERLATDGAPASILALDEKEEALESAASGSIQFVTVEDEPDNDADQSVKTGLEAYKEGRYEEAFEVWLPLAKKGVRRAQFYVGGLYHEGRGVPSDKVAAHYWLSLSDQAGYHRSRDLLKEVAAGMSEDELDAAEKLLKAKLESEETAN